jgi:transposase
MKGNEPVICKKFRKIFRNAGYQTYLVNEFRTSKLCSSCCDVLEYFKERLSNKPKKLGQLESVHGILRCQSVKHKSEIYHNRDKNAVQNMLNIVKSIFDTGLRPELFCRSVL